MTVIDTTETVNVGGEVLPGFELISGFRRHAANRAAIDNKLDPERIHPGMSVTVVVMVPDDDQSDEEFRRDALVRAVTENEQRSSHTVIERLKIAKQFEKEGVSVPRAAAALGVSPTQYKRDPLVATSTGCGKIGWRDLRGLGNVMRYPVWEIITNALDSRSEP